MNQTQFKFQIGQIIQHKRYGYRGVIVQNDPACTAEESWYQKNQTQPKRSQPWYHVLVDAGMHSTYVAEENLEVDQKQAEITHPLVSRFFASYFKGRYYKESLN